MLPEFIPVQSYWRFWIHTHTHTSGSFGTARDGSVLKALIWSEIMCKRPPSTPSTVVAADCTYLDVSMYLPESPKKPFSSHLLICATTTLKLVHYNTTTLKYYNTKTLVVGRRLYLPRCVYVSSRTTKEPMFTSTEFFCYNNTTKLQHCSTTTL